MIQLDFDEAPALDCRHSADNWWTLRTGATWLNVPFKGSPDDLHLFFVGDGNGHGGALGFEVDPTVQRRRVMDKVMLEIFGRFGTHDDFVQFDRTRFIAWDMKLSAENEAPVQRSRMIVWQLWQGKPYSPPLRLELDARNRAVLYLLNDLTGSHPCAADPDCTNLPSEYGGVVELHRTEPLEPDVWHRFAIMVLPRHVSFADKGEVALWMDDIQVGRELHRSHQWIGYAPDGWGNHPDAIHSRIPHPLPRFDTSFGIYRSSQARRHKLVFDRIRVGTRLEDLAVGEPSR